MKRFFFAALSTLALSVMVAPAAQAQTTPNDLVNLARMGYLQEQGIPSHNGLAHAVSSGELSAVDVVKAAIADNRLAPEALNDTAYLSTVEAKLNSLLWN